MLERIVIIGSQGAGKTTLAWQLSNFLGLPIVHLDRYFWQPGWKRIASEDRITTLKNLVQEEWWIIEGSYLNFTDIRYIDLRLTAADTIIFLDTPGLLCFTRMIRRHLEYGERSRPDLPEGCVSRLTLYHLFMTMIFPFRNRGKLLSRIKQSGKQAHRFRSKGDIARFFVSIIDEKRKPLPLVIVTPPTQEGHEASMGAPAASARVCGSTCG